MSEEIKSYKGKVKEKGFFDFGTTYEYLYDYLMDEDYNVFEKSYLEKKRGDSKEVEIIWHAIKSISDYFTIQIKTEWLILGLKSVEVENESGKKIKMDSGTVEIRIKGLLIKDPNDMWEGSPWKSLKKIYDKYIIKKRIENYDEIVKEETNQYINYIKSILKIESQHEITKEYVYT